jgi:hypothetical protein
VRRLAALRCPTLLAAFALAAGSNASSASNQLIDLGPIAVANGTATFTGTLGPSAAGLSLTANGQPLAVTANGAFAGSASLDETNGLRLTLTGAEKGDSTSFYIPVAGTLGTPSGVIPAGVLDQIEQAGVNLVTPVVGDDGLTVSGSVADGSQLSSLTLNGADVLGQVAGDHTFSEHIPGTDLGITLVASSSNGASETINRQLTVSAANADGVKIVSVRFFKKNVRRNGRLRMVVSVRDRQGRMINGARVSVSATKRGFLAKRPHATSTGTRGKTTLTLRVRKNALGKRLVVLTVAKTPSAKARKKTTTQLPARRHA